MATFKPGKDFEKNVLKAAGPGIERIKREKTAEFEQRLMGVKRTHAGRPEAEVLAELNRVVRATPGGRADAGYLATLAKTISGSR